MFWDMIQHIKTMSRLGFADCVFVKSQMEICPETRCFPQVFRHLVFVRKLCYLKKRFNAPQTLVKSNLTK